MSGGATYEFENATVVAETEKALHVQAPDLDPLRCKRWPNFDRCWIPKAAIHEDSEVWSSEPGKRSGKLVLKGWVVDGHSDPETRPPPEWMNKTPPRGREVPTPEVLKNRPLKPPGRK